MDQRVYQIYDGLRSKAEQPAFVATLLTIFALLLTTRLFTPKRESGSPGARIAGSPGYYIPYLGHVPQMSWDTDGFLASLRSPFPSGIFSLHLMGSKHTFVHKPQFSTQLMNKPQSVADAMFLHEHLMVANFGYSKEDMELSHKSYNDVYPLFSLLMSGDALKAMVNNTARNLKTMIADFVTFNSYPADQSEWERAAEADVVEGSNGDKWVQADLVALSKNFIAHAANPSLFGTDFCVNFPDFAECIWEFDASFVLMAMRIPWWLPIPKLNRAKRAQRKLRSYLSEFHEAYQKYMRGEDPGHRWNDLDNVSALVKSRSEQYEKHGFPMATRAGFDLGLLWAMNANSSPMVYWILLHICRDVVLMEQIREEIAPFVQAVQPKNDFGMGVWIPPRIEHLDVDGLITKCPLLKSAYVESMRLYTGSWSIKWINQDTTVGRGDDAYLLMKGEFAHAPQETHQLDPAYFPDPMEWIGDRHVREEVDKEGKKYLTADLGTIRPYGGGHVMCKGRNFAIRELIMFTAAILTMYDIRAPEGQELKVPGTIKQAAAKVPKTKTPVWIKRRELPMEK